MPGRHHGRRTPGVIDIFYKAVPIRVLQTFHVVQQILGMPGHLRVLESCQRTLKFIALLLAVRHKLCVADGQVFFSLLSWA